jgi:hypothetical protein
MHALVMQQNTGTNEQKPSRNAQSSEYALLCVAVLLVDIVQQQQPMQQLLGSEKQSNKPNVHLTTDIWSLTLALSYDIDLAAPCRSTA